ncbi:MAG: hypothetical protein IJW97_07750 [Clostridia bacterium]|nr:hypothetical protein [Clostridia bacterium]
MDKNSTVGYGKILSLFDAGTFVEIGAYVARSDADMENYDGVICGYGSVDGKLTYAFAQDMDRMKGAFGAAGAKKIGMLYRMAIRNGAPVIGIFESAGTVIYDGSAALAAYGAWLKCVSDASGVIPQIALVSGACGGTAAVVASMFDFIIAVQDQAQLYVTTPFVLGKESATAETAASDGLAAIVCDSEAAALAKARELAAALPQNNCDHADAPIDDVTRRLTDGVVSSTAIADFGKTIPLYTAYGEEAACALGYLGGDLVAFVSVTGLLSVNGARKIAKTVNFCDSFNIPVITLVDSEGITATAEEEHAPAAAAFARLASAYATAATPRVTVITGKAYGAAFTLLGSRSLGADLVLALPGTTVSALAPDKAVAFVWNDKITNEKSREEVEAEWIEQYAAIEKAAANGDIDDVIPADELRMRLCSAIYMLANSAEGKPARRHPVMPL